MLSISSGRSNATTRGWSVAESREGRDASPGRSSTTCPIRPLRRGEIGGDHVGGSTQSQLSILDPFQQGSPDCGPQLLMKLGVIVGFECLPYGSATAERAS